jgi:hypothetical protein
MAEVIRVFAAADLQYALKEIAQEYMKANPQDRVVPKDQEKEFKSGDRVILSTKAFVPIVRKAEVVLKNPSSEHPSNL